LGKDKIIFKEKKHFNESVFSVKTFFLIIMRVQGTALNQHLGDKNS